MAEKDVKIHLKEAREYLRNKEFKEALKACKQVLKIDRDNYMAWVLVGAASQESGEFVQALQALQKACTISPDQPLAWQGIVTLSERNPDQFKNFEEQLFPVFRRLIELSENTKRIDLFKTVFQNVDGQEFCGNVWAFLVSLNLPNEFLISLSLEFLPVAKKYGLRECVLAVYECLFAGGVANSDALAQDYFALLEQSVSYEEFVVAVEKYASRYSDSTLPVTLLCKRYVSDNIDAFWPVCMPDSLLKSVTNLSESDQKSVERLEAQIVHAFASGNYDECVKMIEALSSKSIDKFMSFQMRSLAYRHRWQKVCQCFMDLGRNVHKPLEILCYARALIAQYRFDDANKLIDKLDEFIENSDVMAEFLYVKALLALEQKQFEIAENLIKSLNGFSCARKDLPILRKLSECQLSLIRGNYDEACEEVRSVLNLAPDSDEVNHLMGVALWHTEERRNSFQFFSKAAALVPYDFRNFLWLGDYYRTCEKNSANASKCYQRAFQLNRYCQRAALMLSDILSSAGRTEENEAFLKVVTAQSSPSDQSVWAWFRLGLAQLKRKSFVEAVATFQSAVRSNMDDVLLSECLGEAYYRNCSFSSAFKIFKRCHTLDSMNCFYLYMMALSLKDQQKYDEAVVYTKEALSLNPNHIPSLILQGEAYLLMANNFIKECNYELGFDALQNAIDSLGGVFLIETELTLCWKLLGEIFVSLATVSYTPVTISIPKVIQELLRITEHDGETVQCQSLLYFAERSYLRALHQHPTLASLWHDLGIVYLHLHICAASTDSSSSLNRAQSCLKRALTTNPNNELFWNSAGVIAFYAKRYALAQHCFIKSIQVKQTWATPWANLGTLYLNFGDNTLANEAFGKAQSCEPDEDVAWSGQALIAERIMHHETMDLFRHVVEELRITTIPALGFARWCVATILKGEHLSMEAAETAANALHSILKFKRSFCLLIIDGLIKEYLKLFEGSLRSFEDAYGIAKDDAQKDKACLYVARVLFQARKYGQVRDCCERMTVSTDMSQFLIASSMYFIGEHEKAVSLCDSQTCDAAFKEAFSALKRAFLILTGNNQIGKISSSGDAETRYIHKCCAILEGQDEKWANSSDGDEELNVEIECLGHFFRGKPLEGRSRIASAVRMQPQNATLWCLLATYLLCDRHRDNNALLLATRSLETCRTIAESTNEAKTLPFVKLNCLLYVLNGNVEQALKICQTLVHEQPANLEARMLLQWCMLATKKRSVPQQFLMRFANSTDEFRSKQHHLLCNHFASFLALHYFVLNGRWKEAFEMSKGITGLEENDPMLKIVEFIKNICSVFSNSGISISPNDLSAAVLNERFLKNLVLRVSRAFGDPELWRSCDIICFDVLDNVVVVIEIILVALELHDGKLFDSAMQRARALTPENICLDFVQLLYKLRNKRFKGDQTVLLRSFLEAAKKESWMTQSVEAALSAVTET